ncbi:PP2C family protein-serine/threonine phosphatase [Rhodalgimonas zhirmunskyi]|uniref:SpoIIE family protein phosphatase n=1 Tax=Rhodalgimonas zhirmunskyi TaxID=2964767 RepID=A0AAJ1U679_9RHOB|nr:SpoIIE family protein phosphatase [Rhodoalgimonas zhirmunskyi]MDQ2094231.1 SpoIIE family protein phosphatase [Rhodoalgimonas zhirmunskyi]
MSNAQAKTSGVSRNPVLAPLPTRSVLVVDDSRMQRKLLKASLARWGYEVTEADSGQSALEICAEFEPDMVISDWMMPGMDGLQFCKAFRALERENYGYFILLTSKSEKDEVAKGLDNGADDFLTKPVNSAELRARLTAGDRILEMQRELTEKNRLIKSTLDELQSLYDSIDSDLVEAKKLQQSLIRERHRDFGSAQVSLALHSSGHVGGDLVGFYRISKTRIGLYAIDVSGHGISSALMTARLAGYLSSTVPEHNVAIEEGPDGCLRPLPPAKVISYLNYLVLEEMETEHYFTLLLADVDLETGRVRMAQAGQPHPLLQRADGTIQQEGPGGLPVGLIHGAEYEEFEARLNPGDRLLIFSDGIVECPSPEGRLLEEKGLEGMMRNLHETTGTAALEALIWKLSEYAGEQDFPDDVSAILLEYQGFSDTQNLPEHQKPSNI